MIENGNSLRIGFYCKPDKGRYYAASGTPRI